MSKSIYVVGRCDYCDTAWVALRPTPFMGDMPAMMCKCCWDSTAEEYAGSEGAYIGKFEDGPGYEVLKALQEQKEKKEKEFNELIENLRAEYEAGVLESTIETLTNGELKSISDLSEYLEQDLSYAADCCE